ncbi:cupin domain-containing protein [Spirosoma aureum]|uniref:Cupin domain-containing protein n=1 Tax=Spirosoma aureum TaxID=2692134 RepID=A0A6G9AJ80_9BACT|nr:cupin domain-containing protein [Spirosoma aureum]
MPHYHQGFEETVYGEKGIVRWTVNGKTTDIGPGEKLIIPVGLSICLKINRMKLLNFSAAQHRVMRLDLNTLKISLRY